MRPPFEVVHLFGHWRGSIGLSDQRTGTIFSSNAVFDGPRRYARPNANIAP